MNTKAIAKKISEKLDTDPKYAESVTDCSEFFRAAIYESGFVPNASDIDGTDEWNELVDELEEILA